MLAHRPLPMWRRRQTAEGPNPSAVFIVSSYHMIVTRDHAIHRSQQRIQTHSRCVHASAGLTAKRFVLQTANHGRIGILPVITKSSRRLGIRCCTACVCVEAAANGPEATAVPSDRRRDDTPPQQSGRAPVASARPVHRSMHRSMNAPSCRMRCGA